MNQNLPQNLIIFPESPMAVNRNAKELRRIKFKPEKLKDSTSGSDGLANKTQERCEKLVKAKQEMYEAQLAAKRQRTQKRIDIWEQRSTTNVPDSHGLTQNSRTKSSSLASSQAYNHIDSSELDPRFCCTPQSVQQFQNSDSKRSETFTNTDGNEPNNDTSDDGISPIQPGDLDLSNGETENRDRGEDQSFSPKNTIPNGPNDYWKQIQQEIKGYEFEPAVSGRGAKANPVSISVLKCEQQPEKFLKAMVLHSYPKTVLGNLSHEPEQVGKEHWISGRSPVHQFEKKKLDLIMSIYYDYLLKRFNDEEDHERVHYMKKATNDIGRWMKGERLKMRATAISDAEKEAEQIRPLN
ncbi:hypothetical protein QAD02_002743 [Eretmocerus hayati]|uniref:Uncharacterized protein n=1 Tax=Eretmocerus hayati TaxID=131215 RepID=A0ACC2NJQ3_9HYME|nr:hypothetical protein QAD02_002743 [Eretmocerus hayati]